MRKRAIATVSLAGAVIAAIFAGASLLGNYANTTDNLHWTGKPLPPCFVNATTCGGHILGTDAVGRDVLARLIVGARTSLGMSLMGTVCELTMLGLLILATRRGNSAIRFAIGRFTDAISCFTAWPVTIVAASISFGEGSLARLGTIGLLAGVLMGARAVGFGIETSLTPRLVSRVVRDWSTILLMLATVDFFGFGVAPPMLSWGNMLADLQANLQLAWWAAVFPAACLFIAALLIQLGGRATLSDLNCW
jgi:peptide/nickel transport system permease protein